MNSDDMMALNALIERWRRPVISTGDAVHDNAREAERQSCADALDEILNNLRED